MLVGATFQSRRYAGTLQNGDQGEVPADPRPFLLGNGHSDKVHAPNFTAVPPLHGPDPLTPDRRVIKQALLPRVIRLTPVGPRTITYGHDPNEQEPDVADRTAAQEEVRHQSSFQRTQPQQLTGEFAVAECIRCSIAASTKHLVWPEEATETR